MMHAKSEYSDFASLSPQSSYPASPKRLPVYYVQSPSLDSHDDADKASATASCQATPAYNSSSSPMESPSHASTFGRHSNPRSSEASRVSGNWRWPRMNRKRSGKEWQECSLVEEAGVYDDDDSDEEHDGKRPQLLVAVAGLAVVSTVCCVIIWGASRPYKPQISIKSLTVHNFYLGEGADRTGVPTKLLTVNSTATMSVHNPARFFGIHVRSKLLDLMYLELTVATGELKTYYQPKRSSGTISVNLDGRSIPLYGAGATLDDGTKVPMKLNMEIQTLGYLVGKLVKTIYQRRISCSMVFDSEGMEEIKFHQDSCIFS